MTKVYVGKLVSTHGIKGELKLLSDFLYLDRILKPNFTFYIDDNKYFLNSFRFHQKYVLITLNDFLNINDVLFLVGKDVYVLESDLNLLDDEYLLSDLKDALVYEDNIFLGKITEVLLGSKNNFVKVSNDKQSFILPLIKEYVVSFSRINKRLNTKNAHSLII